MNRMTRTSLIATGLVALMAAPAAAATVTTDLNLRSGPGTNYQVITAMPAGAQVDVGDCTGNWCQVNWRGSVGFASASYLSGEGYVQRAPAPAYGYYAYPRYEAPAYWGYGYRQRPGFGIGVSINDFDDKRWGRYHEWQ